MRIANIIISHASNGSSAGGASDGSASSSADSAGSAMIINDEKMPGSTVTQT